MSRDERRRESKPAPPPPADDQLCAVFAEYEDPAVLEQLDELLLQLLRDPKAK